MQATGTAGGYDSAKLARKKPEQLVKAAVRIARQVGLLAVDQTVGQQKDLHPQRLDDHILLHVVSDHQALLGARADAVEQVLVVGKIGLAVAAVFVGGVEHEIVGRESCPGDALFGGDGGEDRVGGEHGGDLLFVQQIQHCPCACIASADRGDRVKILAVEGVKMREECSL